MMTSAIFGDANSGLQVGNNSGSITAEIHPCTTYGCRETYVLVRHH